MGWDLGESDKGKDLLLEGGDLLGEEVKGRGGGFFEDCNRLGEGVGKEGGNGGDNRAHEVARAFEDPNRLLNTCVRISKRKG